MSSLSIKAAMSMNPDKTLREVIENMARSGPYNRIYVYANNYGDKKTHTDFKRFSPADSVQEIVNFRGSSNIRNDVLVYENDKVINLNQVILPGILIE